MTKIRQSHVALRRLVQVPSLARSQKLEKLVRRWYIKLGNESPVATVRLKSCMNLEKQGS